MASRRTASQSATASTPQTRRKALDDLRRVFELIRKSGLPNLKTVLPVLFNLKGKPYSLDEFFPFEPLFSTRVPRNLTVKSGRQVSKSTSLGSRGILFANTIPFYTQLFVTPLYEMIRRLSSNVVKPFIEESPLRAVWTGVNTDSNVLQRSFTNKSKMIFSYAFLSADRTRGISADELLIDESVRSGIVVTTPTGTKPIETFTPGELVYAIDEEGNQRIDEVVTCSCHGYRDCYKITYADGSSVSATSDSFLATTVGWKRVSTIIEDFYTAANSDAAGNDVGGRQYECSQDRTWQSAVSQSARILPERVQHGEIPVITTVRKSTTQKETERRLRGMVECLVDTQLSRIAPYSGFVFGTGSQAGNTDLAGPTDLGRDSLVVHGRRVDIGNDGGVSYTGLLSSRVQSPGFLADAERYRDYHANRAITTQQAEVLLVPALHSGCDIPASGPDSAIYSSANVIQAQFTRAAYNDALQVLSENFSITGNSRCQVRPDTDSLLPREGLPSPSSSRPLQQIHGQAGETSSNQFTEPQTVLRESGGESRQESHQFSQQPCETSRESQSGQTTLLGEETSCSSCATMDLPTLSTDQTTGRQRSEDQILPSVSGNSDTRNQNSLRCQTSEIVSIIYDGRHEVWDISTKHHRSFFAGGVAVHNCQDMDPEFIPIMRETMSASQWGLTRMTGTPKTMENTLQGEWMESSQAEWVIDCRACHYENVPALSHDLDDMIGPYRDDISEAAPGVVCARCRRAGNLVPIFPRTGRWRHNFPDRIEDYAGYHVPQIIMPMHYADKDKWRLLVGKQAGFGNTPLNVFYNEVCGESYDIGAKLVTQTELQMAGCLNDNTLEAALQVGKDRYMYRVLAVDWGGGGEKRTSFTSVAILGYLPTGKIECIYGWRSNTPHDYALEAREVLELASKFSCSHIVHDYTGAGEGRGLFLTQMGFPPERLIPVAYIRAATGRIFRFIEENYNTGQRAHFRADKARSLHLTSQLIKTGLLLFFKYDYKNRDNPGLLHDFLTLVEDKIDGRAANDLYTIIRDTSTKAPDDFAQAVNIGCLALFHMSGNWPNVAEAAHMKASLEQLEAFSPENPDW